MSSAAHVASATPVAHRARVRASRRVGKAASVAAGRGGPAPRRTTIAAVADPSTSAATKLTKDDLVDYIRSGCKPKKDWRCASARARVRPRRPPPRRLSNVIHRIFGRLFALYRAP
jgi:hypothetical protein